MRNVNTASSRGEVQAQAAEARLPAALRPGAALPTLRANLALSSVAFAAQGSSNNTSDQKMHKNSRADHSAASGTSGNRYGY